MALPIYDDHLHLSPSGRNIEALKEYDHKDPLTVTGADGKTYDIYYVAVDGSATVKHPTNYAYTVSGTNEGGVVITVDRSATLNPDTPADSSAGSEENSTAPDTSVDEH